MQNSLMLPHKYGKEQALGTCRLWWHTKLCGNARGGSLSVCETWCAGCSHLPGDRRCTDWAGRTPGTSSRILMPPVFLFLPVLLHIAWFIVSRKGHACDLCWCWWAHSAWERNKSTLAVFCRAANADRVRNSTFVRHTELKAHFAQGEVAVCRESSIILKFQVHWVYTGTFTMFISLFCLKYNKEGRSPQHLTPHPFLVPRHLL